MKFNQASLQWTAGCGIDFLKLHAYGNKKTRNRLISLFGGRAFANEWNPFHLLLPKTIIPKDENSPILQQIHQEKNPLICTKPFFSNSYFSMPHILDNPCWNALNTGNKNLSEGNEQVKYFSGEVSPFVGLPEWNSEAFDNLYHVIPRERRIAFIASKEVEIPSEWEIVDYLKAFQMVHTNPVPPVTASSEIVPLQEENVPQMIALTETTHPGPFFTRTIEFGNYEGIFDGDELVSMAGQRLHAGQYVEISAVCTHLAHTGKGYATQLMTSQVHKIGSVSAIPFLHVKDDNLSAVKLYKSIGFEVRKRMDIYSIRKK